MDKGTTASKHLEHAPGHCDQNQKQHHPERQAVFGQGTANQRFIDNHDAKQRAHANGDGTTHTEVELAGIDQVTGIAEVIDRKQQRQAAHQRAVGLPFEPVQLGRHFFRANVILGYFIKAAAMDGPKVTLDTFLFLYHLQI